MVLVSGSATADGRPLMFKNRDSAEGYNVDMRIVRGEGYTYLAQFHYAEGNRVDSQRPRSLLRIHYVSEYRCHHTTTKGVVWQMGAVSHGS